MKYRAHIDRSPGKLLKFSDGGLKFVLPSGAQMNVVADPEGKLQRAPKLNKKERRRARLQA